MVVATHTDSVSTTASEDEFAISESLVPAREIKAVGITHVGLDGILKPPLCLKEDLSKGCGGQLWPAGIVLAKYMLRKHAFDLHGKAMSVPLRSSCYNFPTPLLKICKSNYSYPLIELNSVPVEG